MRNPVYANIISNSIMRLHQEYPVISIGEHILTALNGSDLYNISDKDFAHALSTYLVDLELLSPALDDDIDVNSDE